METTDVICGGYTTFSTAISNEATKAWNEAFQGFVGVNYTPVAVATQVVNGTNYRFFCNAKEVYPNSANEAAMVEIYKPLNDKARICQIKRCW
ncbi:hypothetical protein EYV94_08810 [Puteibacter caeruleilacunae]|nr:hypothetical protein EYV94_08810 [Puteibacter caeruleilacunae]